MKLSDLIFREGKPAVTNTTADLDNPRWVSADEQNLLDESGNMTFGGERHGHPGLMTIHDVRDVMSGLYEEFTDWERRTEEAGKRPDLPEDLARVLAPPPKPVYVLADILPARAYHTETITLPVGGIGQTGGWTLISARVDRMWIEIVNQGANPFLLSFTDDDINVAGSLAAITIPATAAGTAYVPRRFPIGGKIYAQSALGTVIDFIEAYGLRNMDLDYVNP